ncbi:hypothetical protein EDEG_02979 [Edhazardia aedis USNM 41457]|uniref:AN1-type domain-containing protein n=1 Tax=Edhazardia aedis (strain USNM 41457) TaxID=1003232 RepID=J9D4B1_EDHAE|nr:hypothetical protein EDEG_02979 [Edhazardia aedis USNM 41457]|eukprot:EJW02621.1 hypothetical protein EDEG_02979 [Edhazardia aedis USNM 41457]
MICSFRSCNIKVKIKIECKFCKKMYCGKHRIPEEHECKNMDCWKKEAMERNSSKLLNEKCKGSKV